MEVEAVQLIACLLSIGDVFVDDERGALGVARDALADLTDGPKLAYSTVSTPFIQQVFARYRDILNRSKRSSAEME